MAARAQVEPGFGKWAAISGLIGLGCVSSALPVVLFAPDLTQNKAILDFVRDRAALIQACNLLTSLGAPFMFFYLAGIVDRLRAKGASLGTCTLAFAGLAVPLFGTGQMAQSMSEMSTLLANRVNEDVIVALHTSCFMSTATALPMFAAFYVAMAIGSLRHDAFAHWVGWWSIVAAILQFLVLPGLFEISGPFNVGNGLIALWCPILGGAPVLGSVALSLYRGDANTAKNSLAKTRNHPPELK